MTAGFTFAQITDHHLGADEAALFRGFNPAHALKRTLRHIAAHDRTIDFLVSTGDIVEAGADEEYAFARHVFGITERPAVPGPLPLSCAGFHDLPLYMLPGNHDPRPAFFLNMFAAPAPSAMNVAFSHKGFQFVCLDWGPDNKAVATPGMFDFLAERLTSGLPTILLMHHAVVPMGIGRIDALIADEIGQFEAIVRGRTVLAVLSDHTHASYDGRIADIPVYGLRSTSFGFTEVDGALERVLRNPHYRVVTVSGTSVATRTVEVDL